MEAEREVEELDTWLDNFALYHKGDRVRMKGRSPPCEAVVVRRRRGQTWLVLYEASDGVMAHDIWSESYMEPA
jgi:hypothetical protein